MAKKSEVKLAAKWTDDCGGKKDYDGDILSVSTRYWPANGGFYVMDDERGFRPNDVLGKPSAACSLVLWRGEKGTREDTGGDYINIARAEFEGDTFEDVKVQVEAWAQDVTDRAVAALRREFGPLPAKDSDV